MLSCRVLSPSCTMSAPKLVFPVSSISLHQLVWGLQCWDISSVNSQDLVSLPGLVWDQEADWPWDSTAGSLGWTSLLGDGSAKSFWLGQAIEWMNWEHYFAWGMNLQLRTGRGVYANLAHCPTFCLPQTELAFSVFSSACGEASHHLDTAPKFPISGL